MGVGASSSRLTSPLRSRSRGGGGLAAHLCLENKKEMAGGGVTWAESGPRRRRVWKSAEKWAHLFFSHAFCLPISSERLTAGRRAASFPHLTADDVRFRSGLVRGIAWASRRYGARGRWRRGRRAYFASTPSPSHAFPEDGHRGISVTAKSGYSANENGVANGRKRWISSQARGRVATSLRRAVWRMKKWRCYACTGGDICARVHLRRKRARRASVADGGGASRRAGWRDRGGKRKGEGMKETCLQEAGEATEKAAEKSNNMWHATSTYGGRGRSEMVGACK